MAEPSGTYDWSIIISGFALILSFLTSLWTLFVDPKRKYKKELKIEVIKEILPKLLSDMRNTISQFRRSKNNFFQKLNIFNYLGDISTSGQIESIYFVDQELYENVKRINETIRELIVNYTDMKSEFYRTYMKIWKEYLNSKPRHFKTERLTSDLDINYPLWREDYEYIETEINKWFQIEIGKSTNVIPLTPSEIKELIEILKLVVETSKTLIPEIEKELQEHVEAKVNPTIEKLIRNPV